jgi:D-amino-acid dehydrogenase
MRIVVIGGGAIGLASAYALATSGAHVTLLDARGVGGGASRRNAGWIVPTMSGPVPAPGLVLKSLRWLLRPDSPLRIRPSLEPEHIAFLLGMIRHCNTADFERGLRQTLALNQRTFELFDQLAADGVRFEQHQRGVLSVFATHTSFDEHVVAARQIAELAGHPSQVLTGRQAQALEPRLSRRVVGAILAPSERFVDPDQFIDALATACLRSGVAIHTREPVTDAISGSGGRVNAVVTRSARWQADAFVLASGAWTGVLARLFGHRLPIQAGKGYGHDLSATGASLRHALYLAEAKVAVTPLLDRTRLSGTMEFGGLDEGVNQVRAAGIVTSARTYLDLPTAKAGKPWSGLRPMTPDGLPLLGPLPGHPNVIVATGHAMLGITLAPVTGDIVRQILLDGQVPMEATAFAPDRFRRSRRRARSVRFP